VTSQFRTSRRVGPAIALLAFTAIAACQAGTSGATDNPTRPTGNAQIQAIGREYSQCVRDHGLPSYPDLVVEDGQLTLPNDGTADANRQALRDKPDILDACRPILDKLPANAQKSPALSDQDRQNLLTFAQCMRDHGVPEWPDPRANGSFPIAGTPLETERSERVASAQKACRQYWDRPIPVK
jgi:hypothetical protein